MGDIRCELNYQTSRDRHRTLLKDASTYGRIEEENLSGIKKNVLCISSQLR